MNFFSVIIGASIGILFYVMFAGALKKFWIAPPAEPDPNDMAPVDMNYRCGVCGAEVTMTMSPLGDEPTAPRHCREDMVLTTSN